FHRADQRPPLGGKAAIDALAVLAAAVVAAWGAVFDFPFALQQALLLPAAGQRVKRALLDRHALGVEQLAQRIALLVPGKLREHGEHQDAAAQLLLEPRSQFGMGFLHRLRLLFVSIYIDIHSSQAAEVANAGRRLRNARR